jgi:hypothetical protein
MPDSLDDRLEAHIGRGVPSKLDQLWLIMFMSARSWAKAKLAVAQGVATEQDYFAITYAEADFARWGVTAKDFGFDDIPPFELDVPAGATWGRA